MKAERNGSAQPNVNDPNKPLQLAGSTPLLRVCSSISLQFFFLVAGSLLLWLNIRYRARRFPGSIINFEF